MTLSRAGSTGHRHYLPTCRETSLWKHWWREVSFSIKRCDGCVCTWRCVRSKAFVCKCEFVYLWGHVYKKSSPGCHTQTYKCRFDRNNPDLPRLSGSQSACHRASSSHPCSLNSYFTLICIFFTTAQSFIRADSSSDLNIFVLHRAQLGGFTLEF